MSTRTLTSSTSHPNDVVTAATLPNEAAMSGALAASPSAAHAGAPDITPTDAP